MRERARETERDRETERERDTRTQHTTHKRTHAHTDREKRGERKAARDSACKIGHMHPQGSARSSAEARFSSVAAHEIRER